MDAREYVWNKVLSVGIPIVVIVVSIPFFTHATDHWRFLLFCTVILGYTHYLIGGFYQVKGLWRKPNRNAFLLGFFLLSVVAAGLWYWSLVTGNMVLLAFLMIPYFMIHGFFNEQMFVDKTFRSVVPFGVVGSLSVWLTAMTTLSFFHPSAFFDDRYTYQFQTIESVFQFTVVHSSQMFLYAQVLGVVGVILAFGWLLYTMHSYRKLWVTLPVLLLGVLGTASYFFLGTFNYVYMFSILLSFHFLTWLLFFGVRFYERSGRALAWYIFWHVVIIGAMSISLLFATDLLAMDFVSFVATNSYIFLLLTTIHITTSFLNEPWFQRWFGLVPQR